MTTSEQQQASEEIENWTMVFPNQANPNGVMFGGDLLAIMDTTAAMAAKRFCQMEVSTVSVEAVHFAKPFRVGDTIKTAARVVAVGNSSMIVKTEAFKDIGNKQLEKAVSAYYFLVAFDQKHKTARVPRLKLDDKDSKEQQIALIIKAAAEQRQAQINLLAQAL